jgi:glycine betaine/proline transport system ATP-binding protein
MVPKIRFEDVVKIFGRRPDGEPLEMLRGGASKAEVLERTRHVIGVAGVTLDVVEGEIFVVMGLSGSGKSTLVRMANRLHEPTAGHVFVDGEDVCSVHRDPADGPAASERRMQEIRRTKMAMVFQHFGLFPHLTVADNVAYGLKVQGADEEHRRRRAWDVLEQVGLRDWAEQFPNELSGGMQQRVGLARALATDPDILLMDEAFSALDPLIRRNMQDELLELQSRLRKTILFVTHDINEAFRLGNRVAIMKDGLIVQVGTPTEIVTQPEDDYVAEFMADVDQAKVVSVGYVMSKVRPLVLGETTLVAARNAAAREGAFYLIDDEGRPVGLATAQRLEDAIGNASDDLSSALERDFPRAAETVVCAELFGLCGSGYPIAVVDEQGRLQGVVQPLELLSRLGAVEVVATGAHQRPGASETEAEAKEGVGDAGAGG